MTKDIILQMIDDAMEANQETKSRGYLGFSEIGDKCTRKLWYSYHHNQEKKPFKADTLKKFADGHCGEDVMDLRIREAGIFLTLQQKEYSMFDGKFQGHIDGLIIHPETGEWMIWEHKVTEKPPKEGEALMSWNYQYYCQAQMYMHCSGIHKHYTTISSPGERRTICLYTDYNELIAKELIEKAEYIIETDIPPSRISETPAFYYCKYFCNYREVCHG